MSLIIYYTQGARFPKSLKSQNLLARKDRPKCTQNQNQINYSLNSQTGYNKENLNTGALSTVELEQVIFADMLFSRSADFAIPRILIFADVGAGNTRSCIALLSYTYFLFLMNYY